MMPGYRKILITLIFELDSVARKADSNGEDTAIVLTAYQRVVRNEAAFRRITNSEEWHGSSNLAKISFRKKLVG